MTTGFVLISTAPSKERSVYSELLKIHEIVELHAISSDHGLIAKVETKDTNHLSEIVLKRIRSIPGVIDTDTSLVVKL